MEPLVLLARDKGVLQNFRLYYYEPSMPAACIFTVIFGIATLAHVYRMFRTRTWFMIPFIIGGIFETVGYVGRAIGSSENPGPYILGPFVLQSVLLLVAPALFAASIYMELGRIVVMVQGEKVLFIRRTWLTKMFVIGDVFAFCMQAGGAGLLSSGTTNLIDTGNDILITGLFCQVVFFGLFVTAAAVFHVRMNKAPTSLALERPWVKHMLSLYIVSALIFVRSIARCVEYIEGYGGYIMSHEVFLYTFDGTAMFSAVVTMLVTHPGEVARYVRELRSINGRTKEGSA